MSSQRLTVKLEKSSMALFNQSYISVTTINTNEGKWNWVDLFHPARDGNSSSPYSRTRNKPFNYRVLVKEVLSQFKEHYKHNQHPFAPNPKKHAYISIN